MSNLLSHLMRFSSGSKPWHAVPFSLKCKKVSWTVATDSFVLLAIKTAGATFRKDYPKELVDMLSDDPISPVEIDVAALKQWSGAPPSKLIPPGGVDPEHQGVLFGYAVDRRKLAFLLSIMSLPTVKAWVAGPHLIAFEPPQGQWRALLSCLRDVPEGDELVFQVVAPAAPAEPKSVFDLVQEVGSE